MESLFEHINEYILTSVRAGKASYLNKFKEYCEMHGIMRYGYHLDSNGRTLVENSGYKVVDGNVVLDKDGDYVIQDNLPNWVNLIGFANNNVQTLRLSECTNFKNLPQCDYLLLSECTIKDFSEITIRPKFITLQECKFNDFYRSRQTSITIS